MATPSRESVSTGATNEGRQRPEKAKGAATREMRKKRKWRCTKPVKLKADQGDRWRGRETETESFVGAGQTEAKKVEGLRALGFGDFKTSVQCLFGFYLLKVEFN